MTDDLVRLALYTGQPLDQVTRSDLVAMSFARAYESYWPPQTELLASIVEHLSALLVAFLRANGAKNVGAPLRIPRPTNVVMRPPEPGEFEAPSDTRVAAGSRPAGAIGFGEFRKMLEAGHD